MPFCQTESNDAQWMSRFQQLKDYRAKHGHFEVTYKQDMPFRQWIYRQKIFFKKNELPQKRRDLLNSIGLFDQNEPVAKAKSNNESLFDLTLSDEDEESDRGEEAVLQQPCRRISLVDRTLILEDAVGVTTKSNDILCNRVKLLEMELFGKAKVGRIAERINALENEVE